MQAPLILENLVKDYGSFRAVNQVSLAMEPGEIFGLLGPNGAGKTSIISILTMLETATAGQATIFGKSVATKDRQIKQMVGCVPQELVSHGFFTIDEILRFHSGYYGISDNRAQINYLLDRLDLTAHRKKKVRQLSGGMRRRLLIAKALVHQPKLLLLDEPTAGVDVELRNSLWEFVRELHAGGTSVLLTTHYLEEAEMLCRRVGILHHGQLLEVGEVKPLIRRLTARKITITLRNPIPAIHHPRLVSQTNEQISFQVPNDLPLGQLLREINLSTENLGDVKLHEGSLEEAFLSLVGEKH